MSKYSRRFNPDDFCSTCDGTGEGQTDGSRGWKCGGTGINRDYDYEEERKAAAADYYNDMREDMLLDS